MKPKNLITSILLLLLMPAMTGCWDRKELNNQAIMTAWGMDLNKDGTVQGIGQFAIPSKMGSGETASQGKSYFIATGNGRNPYEAASDMQLKISRPWFTGHRKVILIGETLAKHGLANILDEASRNPVIRLRSDLLVLKGGSVQDYLELSYPLERLSSNALVKLQETAGLKPYLTFRNFLMAAAVEESCPFLPVIEKTGASSEENSQRTDPEIKLWGFAIFNKDSRLVGYLPMKESYILQWIKGQLKFSTLMVNIPGEKEKIVVEAKHLKSKITTSWRDRKVHIDITLSGKGSIRENNTHIDLTDSKTLTMVQNELNKQTIKNIYKNIQQVQTLGTDIFGFEEAFHRQHPYAWKELKKDWVEKFTNAEVSVTLNLQILETGLTGPSEF